MTPVLDITAEEGRNLYVGGAVTLPGELRPWKLHVSHVWDDPCRMRGRWVHGRDEHGVPRTVRVEVSPS